MQPEIAHLLLIDVVGFSKLLDNADAVSQWGNKALQILDDRLKRHLKPINSELFDSRLAIARSALQKMKEGRANDTPPRRRALTRVFNELLDQTARGAGRGNPDLLRLADHDLLADDARSGMVVQEVASLVLLAKQLQDMSGNYLNKEEHADLIELSDALLHSGVMDILSPTMKRQLVFSWQTLRTRSAEGSLTNVSAVEEEIIRHSAHLSCPEEKVQLLTLIPDDLLLSLLPTSRHKLAQALLGELSREERELFHSQYSDGERPGVSDVFRELI